MPGKLSYMEQKNGLFNGLNFMEVIMKKNMKNLMIFVLSCVVGTSLSGAAGQDFDAISQAGELHRLPSVEATTPVLEEGMLEEHGSNDATLKEIPVAVLPWVICAPLPKALRIAWKEKASVFQAYLADKDVESLFDVDDNGCSVLHYAISNQLGDADAVVTAIITHFSKHQVAFKRLLLMRDHAGRNALFYALASRNILLFQSIVRLVFDSYQITDLEKKQFLFLEDTPGYTIFHWAALDGHDRALFWLTEFLLKRCDPASVLELLKQKNEGKTALDCAVNNGHTKIAKYLKALVPEHATEEFLEIVAGDVDGDVVMT